jgi:hypothetical protein
MLIKKLLSIGDAGWRRETQIAYKILVIIYLILQKLVIWKIN